MMFVSALPDKFFRLSTLDLAAELQQLLLLLLLLIISSVVVCEGGHFIISGVVKEALVIRSTFTIAFNTAERPRSTL